MTSLKANGLLLLAAFFWGAGNVAQKTVLDDIGPLTAVGLRCLIGALVLIPFVRREASRAHAQRKCGVLQILWVAGLFAMAIVLQQSSYGSTTVTNASFLVSLTTVLTPIAVWLLFKIRPTPIIWAAATTAFAGAFLMSGGSIASMAIGDLGCVASAAFYAVWFVKLGEVVVASGRPCNVTLVQFGLTGVVCLVVGLVLEPVTSASLLQAMPDLIVLGVFATGVAYGLQAVAQQTASPTMAALLTSMESVFGAAAAVLFLGEQLTPMIMGGAVLVVLAILMAQSSADNRARLEIGASR